MKRIFISMCILLYALTTLLSQGKLELRLVPTNMSGSAEELCFDTQFKNISNSEIKLTGQNYRLFYDALQLKFKGENLKSLLPTKSYGTVDMNQSLHNIDARGYGDLKFGQNLGFLNYSIRLTEDEEELITLPPFSPWVSTTNVCFNATDALGPINIIWAREGLTSGYATAFTEISALNEDNYSQPVLIQVYQDYIKLTDGTGVNDPMVLQSSQNH